MAIYINEFNIDEKLKKNRLIKRYIMKFYNNGKVFNNEDEYDYKFYIFKEDCISCQMPQTLYNLLLLIKV